MKNSALRADDAEMCLIGTIIRKGRIPTGIEIITPESFYLPDARRAFEAFQRLQAENIKIEIVTVDEALQSIYGTGTGNTSFLFDCIRATPHSTSELYAPIVHEAASRRMVYTIAKQLAMSAENATEDLKAAADSARAILKDVGARTTRWDQTADMLLAAYGDTEARAQGKIKPIESGVKTLDQLIGGFFPGELNIIGARPSVGKTAFALQVALSAGLAERKVCFVSAEMIDVQIGQRVLANAAQINSQRLGVAQIRDEDWIKLSNAMQDYSQLPISWMFRTRFIEDIAAEATRKAELGECEMLIVDYIQLLQTRQQFKQDYKRVGYISEVLKNLTTDLRIPVIALAQVSRDSSGRCPVLRDLRDSGELEQNADNVIFLHRPDSIDDPYIREEDKHIYRTLCGDGGAYQYIAMSVAKQRQGQTGVCSALFNPSRATYMGTKGAI